MFRPNFITRVNVQDYLTMPFTVDELRMQAHLVGCIVEFENILNITNQLETPELTRISMLKKVVTNAIKSSIKF